MPKKKERLVMYRPTPALAAQLGGVDLPIPVRASRAERVFGGSVDLVGLVDELVHALEQDPSLVEVYRRPLRDLALVAGRQMVKDRFLDAAIHVYENALRYDPKSIRLRTAIAIALQLAGRHADAKAHYDPLLGSRALDHILPLWVMAARNEADRGDPRQAYALLRVVAPAFTRHPEFWDLLGEYRQKAGIEPAKRPASPATEWVSVPAARGWIPVSEAAVCSACKAPLPGGAAFCDTCGAPVQAAKPHARSCPSCGTDLPPNARFCPECGSASCDACGSALPQGARFCGECGEEV